MSTSLPDRTREIGRHKERVTIYNLYNSCIERTLIKYDTAVLTVWNIKLNCQLHVLCSVFLVCHN